MAFLCNKFLTYFLLSLREILIMFLNSITFSHILGFFVWEYFPAVSAHVTVHVELFLAALVGHVADLTENIPKTSYL
jgi:hypothetical protein